MTKEEVIAMAREAEIYVVRPDEFQSVCIDDLTRFAKLVRDDYSNKHAALWLRRMDEAVRAEREACALVCGKWDDDVPFNSRECAEAIRSRGKV